MFARVQLYNQVLVHGLIQILVQHGGEVSQIYTVFCRGTAHTCIIAQPQTLENLDFFALYI